MTWMKPTSEPAEQSDKGEQAEGAGFVEDLLFDCCRCDHPARLRELTADTHQLHAGDLLRGAQHLLAARHLALHAVAAGP